MGAFQPHGGPFTQAAVSLFSPAERADLREIQSVNEIEGAILAHEFENPDEQQVKLAAELCDVQVFDSADGQEFSGLWLNRRPRDSEEKPLLLVGNGFLSDVTHLDAKFRAYFLAREFPGSQILVYDQPGHGLSSRYTRLQRKGMWHGNMEDVGQQQMDAVEHFAASYLAPAGSVELKAESLASRQGLEVALASQDTSLPVAAMTLLELPGTEDGRRFGIHGSYFGYEFLRASYYNAKWLDPLLEGAFKGFLRACTGKELPKEASSFFIRDPLMSIENFMHSTLGQGTGLAVLQKLVDQDVEIVRVTGQKSRIDRVSAAEAQRRSMLEATGRSFGQVVLMHESHDGTGTASRARLSAKLSRFTLNNAESIIALLGSYPTSMRHVQQGAMLAPQEITV